MFASVFFFSSRRRHTRLLCDWSSDVCSSDLAPRNDPSPPTTTSPSMLLSATTFAAFACPAAVLNSSLRAVRRIVPPRSEERRVRERGEVGGVDGRHRKKGSASRRYGRNAEVK